jgi:hypothetical protein
MRSTSGQLTFALRTWAGLNIEFPRSPSTGAVAAADPGGEDNCLSEGTVGSVGCTGNQIRLEPEGEEYMNREGSSPIHADCSPPRNRSPKSMTHICPCPPTRTIDPLQSVTTVCNREAKKRRLS